MCYPICVTCVTFCFCLILALLKPLKNQRVSDFFRGYRKRPVVWNELKSRSDEPLLQFMEIETRFNSHYIKKCPYKKWKDGCQFFLLFNSTVKLAFSGVEIFSLSDFQIFRFSVFTLEISSVKTFILLWKSYWGYKVFSNFYLLSIKDTLYSFDDLANEWNSIWSSVFWHITVFTFGKFMQNSIHWDKIQILPKFS